MTSGATPHCSQASQVPVRPAPVWHFVGDQQDAVLVRTGRAGVGRKRATRRRSRLHLGTGSRMMAATRAASTSYLNRASTDAMASSSLTAVQRVRELGVEHLGREGSEAGFVGGDLAGQCHAHHGAAVETAAEGDDGRALGVGAGHLDRVFHRFGAGRQEEALLGEVARRHGVELFGQFHVGLIGQHLEAGVGEALELVRHGLDQCRVAVTGVEHRDAASEVDVSTAFHVPDFGAFGRGRQRSRSPGPARWAGRHGGGPSGRRW